MVNNYYELYKASCIKLASTLTIKSTDTCAGFNKWVVDYYGISSLDKTRPDTWKYYMNLSGEYHFTDEPMYVDSLDSLEHIEFTKDNLSFHAATRRAYGYGSRRYNELVTKYPEQELLIRGILYPADKEAAIAGDDGLILSYPNDLIEDHEYSLVPRLQKWIYNYKMRWVNPQYSVIDSLYPAVHLGIMYLNLVPAIMEFRLASCKTNEAHSYHIKQYLASHGYLDKYINSMTISQMLFLYRNIVYIAQNSGKNETFEWLVDHIMTERALPIAEYKMYHNSATHINDLLPNVTFIKKPINSVGVSSNKETTLSLKQIFFKEDSYAKDNVSFRNEYMEHADVRFKNSQSSVGKTKVLETSVIDRTNSNPYTLSDVLLNHWIAFSADGYYTNATVITNPRTGYQVALNAYDTFIAVWYMYQYSTGERLTYLPAVFAKRIYRYNDLPTTAEILNTVGSKYIDKDFVDELLSVKINVMQINNTQDFYNTCYAIYQNTQKHRLMIANREHYKSRGAAHAAVSRIYNDRLIQFGNSNITYTQWFKTKNLDLSELTENDMGQIYLDVLKSITGISEQNQNTLNEIQSSMVKLLTQLSSYSIQILREVSNAGLQRTDWPSVRLGDVSSGMLDKRKDEISQASILDVNSITRNNLTYNITESRNNTCISKRASTLKYNVVAVTKSMSKVNIGPIKVPVTTFNTPNAFGDMIFDNYNNLSSEQKAQLKDAYTTYPAVNKYNTVKLSDVIIDTDLTF